MMKNDTSSHYVAYDVSQELLPLTIDRLAQEDPHAIFVTIVDTHGLEPVSFSQYANAINGVAWWIENQMGRGHGNNGIVYLGTGGGDLFYAVLMVAALKAGYHMVFNSPRNSIEAHMSLLAQQQCRILIAPDPQPPYVATLLDAYSMQLLLIPTLSRFMQGSFPHYEYKKTFHEGRKDLLVSLHTSGSTGLPKPIIWTLVCAAITANTYQAPIPDAQAPIIQLYRTDAIFSAMPMFHPPAFSQAPVDRQDWDYMHFSPLTGVGFRPFSEHEYEMIVVKDKTLPQYQPYSEMFPDDELVSSHDLFSKHPVKPDLWHYCGRSDDVIVFLNGEKTNPVGMEGLISARPEVRNALVFGQGRFEAGLLIEPSNPSHLSVEERATLIESVWPTIQEANRQCPAHARIMKWRVLFTTPEKPMSRAGKGTVQRKATFAAYSQEIDDLYSDSNILQVGVTPFELDSNDLEGSIHRIVSLTTSFDHLAPTDDLFSRGMDSLQVIQVVRLVKSMLEHNGMKHDGLAPSTVYLNPTIAKLTATIQELGMESQISEFEKEEGRAVQMRSMLEKYSPPIASLPVTSERQKRPRTILITGSTGSLGTYLLDIFAANELITKIYCLNRSPDSKQRQTEACQFQGLPTRLDDQRITFLTGDLSKDDLGLGPQMFAEVKDTVDLIIHNA
ncbi:MAG: hypothetical protein Q9222_000711 [Ikaeria aurantiellina]